MVLNTNGHHLEGAALFEEAVTALRRETYCGASAPKTAAKDPVSSTSATPVNRDVATRSTTRASVPLTAQVTYAGPAGATSRSLCLQFLLQVRSGCPTFFQKRFQLQGCSYVTLLSKRFTARNNGCLVFFGGIRGSNRSYPRTRRLREAVRCQRCCSFLVLFKSPTF